MPLDPAADPDRYRSPTLPGLLGAGGVLGTVVLLRRRGRLFHYTGSPNKLTSGRDVPREVAKRLEKAGFADVSFEITREYRSEEAGSFLATDGVSDIERQRAYRSSRAWQPETEVKVIAVTDAKGAAALSSRARLILAPECDPLVAPLVFAPARLAGLPVLAVMARALRM
mgnify:CR=1 FL=1